MRCNRVITWQPAAVEITVWSPELDDILGLLENKRERNDPEGLKYNARRYVKTAGLLADKALYDLALIERNKHTRLMSTCYLVGAIAVISSPLTLIWLIVPVALTLLATEIINYRMKRRVADILSFSVSQDSDMKISLKFPDQPAALQVTTHKSKGGADA